MSALFLVPLNPDGDALFNVEVALEGVTHRFRFDWNGREARWYVDWIGFALRRKVLPGWPVFRRVRGKAGAPLGQVMFANAAPDNRPPNFDELGTRTRMVYVPAVTS